MHAGDGVMVVVFNDPVPVENPALQAVLMALKMRDAIEALTETWRRWGHDNGFGIGRRRAIFGKKGPHDSGGDFGLRYSSALVIGCERREGRLRITIDREQLLGVRDAA